MQLALGLAPRRLPGLVSRAVLFLLLAGSSQGAPGLTTTARLVLSHEKAKPGETVWAGVHFRMAPGWHIYWENSGDSGIPTRVEWDLPATLKPGELLWPAPQRFEAGGLVTYGYEGEVVLLTSITVPSGTASGSVTLRAKASWLECIAEKCVPGTAPVAAQLTIGEESRRAPEATLIEFWRGKLPETKPGSFARAWWEAPAVDGNVRALLLEWPGPATNRGQPDFLPYSSTNFLVRTPAESVAGAAGSVALRKEVEKTSEAWPVEMAGLLFTTGVSGSRTGVYQTTLTIGAAPTEGVASASASLGGGPSAPPRRPLVVWLGLAFLGGIILNLMPCVLPVIALKIFGFVNQARETPAQVRKLGVVYGIGVVFSFLVLAGLVIAVQSAGRLASWGMQFGNPYFLVGMVTLVTLVALNLFGVFEVTLSGGAMGTAAELSSREGASGAFFNGVLATALATPCTAPFLAGALGFAFSQPPGIIVLVFATAGLGLAAPYVLLSFEPAWLVLLPKPGAWMEHFRVAMGFPMLATALWLFSLVSRHYGTAGILWIGIFLVFVAVAAWIWGVFVQRGQKHRGLAMALTALLLVGGYVLTLERQLQWRHPPRIASGQITAVDTGGIPWQPWSVALVDQARASGRAVLVDFTADWCVTCQVNKKTSIEIDAVRQRLKERNILPLIGDYTLSSAPEAAPITEELKRFARAGVPLVLIYPRDPKKPPIELPPLLTPSIVLDALDQATK